MLSTKLTNLRLQSSQKMWAWRLPAYIFFFLLSYLGCSRNLLVDLLIGDISRSICSNLKGNLYQLFWFLFRDSFPLPCRRHLSWQLLYLLCGSRRVKRVIFYAGWEKCLTPQGPENAFTLTDIKSQTLTHLLQKGLPEYISLFILRLREYFKLTTV